MGQILKQVFRFGGPETIGLMILGATIGAVAGGAASDAHAFQAVTYAGFGSVFLPVLVSAPWTRLGLWIAERRSPLA